MGADLRALHGDLIDLVGQTIADRYRIDAVVGSGGMGAVFRAHHLGLERDVAIKVLHPSFGRDPETSARFDTEAKSTSRLDHPNCLQVMDYGTTDAGMKFMVMQLLEGRELMALLGKPLPSLRAVELCLQIGRALGHAHGQGIVHRDIKPENVLVTRDGGGHEVLKLVDFGIAKIIDGGGATNLTRAGLVFGTPAYMSPEQATGSHVDERTDLYALGIILYEMLTGHPPFSASDPVTLVRLQVTAEAPALPSDVPYVLANIVERLLIKDKEQRLGTATELCDLLEHVQAVLRGNNNATEQFPAPTGARIDETLSPLETGASRAATARTLKSISDQPKHRKLMVAAVGVTAIAAVAAVATVDWGNARGNDSRFAGDRAVDDASVDQSKTDAKAGATAEQLADIDGAIAAGKEGEADKRLSVLRDQYPSDPQLLWRQGRLLARNRSKRALALAAYSDALEQQQSLARDPQFFSELDVLLHQGGLRDEALDVALHYLGEQGHPFLLELVNDEKRPLSYSDRHRALTELDADVTASTQVNRQLMIALDLLQATQSLTPCTAYQQALREVISNPDPYFVPRLERSIVPSGKGADPEEALVCRSLPLGREQTLVAMAKRDRDRNSEASARGGTEAGGAVSSSGGSETPLAPQAPDAPGVGHVREQSTADAEASADERPSANVQAKPRRRTSSQQRECDKIGGIFKRNCWR